MKVTVQIQIQIQIKDGTAEPLLIGNGRTFAIFKFGPSWWMENKALPSHVGIQDSIKRSFLLH